MGRIKKEEPSISEIGFGADYFYYLLQCLFIYVVLQPSIIGMEPPFADAFQNYSFADQALTSTDLLASNSDPDFMYELVSG